MTKIAIIGGKGKIGSAFAQAFKEKGHEVIVSSRSTEIKPTEAVRDADIVIVSVPIEVTEAVIKEISSHVKKDAILSDFTSVKIMPCKAMKKYSKSEVIGCHPLFGPGVEIKGQKIVFCSIRTKKRAEEYKHILESIGLEVILMNPKEHDKQMALIQCLNHIDSIAFGNYLLSSNFDLNSKLITPAFLLKRSVVGRMLSQETSLYPSILVHNPYSKKIIKEYSNSIKNISKLIKNKDQKGLESEIKKLQDYFGSLAQESREITNKLLESMKHG